MNATLPPQIINQSEMYTYIAVPVDALQSGTDLNVQPLAVAVFRALPDGNIIQQLQQSSENIVVTRTSKSVTNNITGSFSPVSSEEKQSFVFQNSVRPSVIEQNNFSLNTSDVQLTSNAEYLQTRKPEIRYLRSKSSQLKIIKTATGIFKCNVCGEMLDKMILYRKHMEGHRNSKKYKCQCCMASYNVEDNFKLHMAIHSKGEPTCPICNRQFQRLASLKAHIIIHEVEETFVCTECLAEYEYEDDFNKHIESHKNEHLNTTTEKTPLQCSFCTLTFEDSSKYKEHISFHIKLKKLITNGKKYKRRVTNDKEHLYKCNICDKSFTKYCLLERHLRIHSGEKPFACHLCDRAFNQKGTLQIHLARHSGVKPFQCTLCSAKFCQKGNLQVHVQKTHMAPASGEKVFKCTLCTCIFKKISSLNAHITRAHAGDKQTDDIADVMQQLNNLEKQLQPQATPSSQAATFSSPLPLKEEPIYSKDETFKYVKLLDNSVEGNIRKYLVRQKRVDDLLWYVCNSCSKEFKKPSDLIRHIRTHTKEKPFKCKNCDQAFSLKSTLTTHMTTHLGKKRQKGRRKNTHTCNLCTRIFPTNQLLQSHTSTHQGNTRYSCSLCNMEFDSIEKAKMHLDVHRKGNTTSDRPFNLGKVDIVMEQPMIETSEGLQPVEFLKAQNDAVKSGTPQARPYKCEHCSSAFTKSVHLKRHILIHTGEKKFKCHVCLKCFYSSYSLKEHLQFHSGEKNFTCKVCDKKFVTKQILKRHLRSHSSSAPYICPYCDKRFKTIMLCRKHIKIHKKSVSTQMSNALNGNEELKTKTEADETPVLNLNEDLVENSLSLGESTLGTVLGNLSNNEIALDSNQISILQTSKEISKSQNTEQSDSENTTQVYTAPNTMILNSSESTFGNNVQPFNHGMLTNFVNNTNLSVVQNSTAELVNVEGGTAPPIVQENVLDDNGTVYINPGYLQPNLYNACLAQLKFQNNDPFLMSGASEIQDPSVLFSSEAALNQVTDSQPFEMLMPTFTLYNNVALSTNSLNSFITYPNIILSNIEENTDANQSLSSEISENEKPDLFNSKVAPGTLETQTIDLNETVDINQEPILSNLFYNATNHLEASDENGISDEEKSNCNVEIINHSARTLNNNEEAVNNSAKIINENEILNHNGEILDKEVLNTNETLSTILMQNVDNSEIIANAFKKVDFTCSNCKEPLKNVNSLKNHKCRRPNNGEIDNARLFNNKKNSGRSLLKPRNKVTKLQIPENKPGFKCTYCDKTLATKNALARHVLKHQGKRSGNNSCSYCGKVFKKPSDLERHIRKHTGEKPFGCDKCGKCFSLKSTLESHIRTHAPGGNKDFCCAVCNSYFSSKSSLRVHMLVHTGVKPYQCPMCPEKFRTVGHRKSHIAVHLKKPGGKKPVQSKTGRVSNFLASLVLEETLQNNQSTVPENENQSSDVMLEAQRELCDRAVQVDSLLLEQLQLNNVLLQENSDEVSFVQIDINSEGQVTGLKPLGSISAAKNANLNNQLCETLVTEKTKSQESVILNNSTVKRFFCSFCNKNYSTRQALANHKKTHGIEAAFKCKKCDMTFDTSNELDEHLQQHPGNHRPYSCQFCANTFSQLKNLKTHIKRIHNVKIS